MTIWTHLVEVEIKETPEDWVPIQTRLTVRGIKETPEYFDQGFGNRLPGDPAELELLLVEIVTPNGWREARRQIMFDHRDQAVLDAVDGWWDDHADETWASADGA